MAKRRSKKNSSGTMWLITVLLIAVLIAGLLYLQKNSLPPVRQPIIATKKSTAPATDKPQFDFYTVLPQNKEAIIKSPSANFGMLLPPPKDQPITPALTTKATLVKPNTTTPSKAKSTPPKSVAKNTTPVAKTVNNIKYILQIAAVKDYATADQLKAELTLMGYTVTIQKITLDNATWNRVNLGPYTSLTSAQAAQTDLHKNKIQSFLVQVK